MKINLDFLKFHYFYRNNKLHNCTIKKYEQYFNDIFFKHDYSLLNILKIIKKNKNITELKNELLHFHKIEKNQKYILWKEIIEKCHPNLFNQIEQYFYTDDNNLKDLNFYQCKISKKERLIFTFHKNLDNKLSFIPLIFDLNHLIYNNKTKNFDNKNLQCNFKWDLKKTQEKIKENLKQQIRISKFNDY